MKLYAVFLVVFGLCGYATAQDFCVNCQRQRLVPQPQEIPHAPPVQQSYGSTGSSYSGGSSGSAGYRPSSGGYYGSMAMVRAASDQNTWVAVHLRQDHGVDTSGMTLAQMEARHAQIHAMEGRRAWRPLLFGRWR